MGKMPEYGKGNGIPLGINGLGRIGKLTLWHHVGRKYFSEIVVNMGRRVGSSIADLAHYIERDSTYGSLHAYLYGHRSERLITDLDDENGTMRIDGVPVRILRDSRDPRDIAWDVRDVKLVVDTTGQFLDPTLPPDQAGGSIRGHFDAGVQKIIVSAPFKIKDKSKSMPEDAVTTVMGINDNDYNPLSHHVISNASCTTTCLAHMMKPLIDSFGPKKILTASMATVHAATGSQQVLDRPAKSGATDLRKNRSILNNIILTTTGAAKTLGLVIPAMSKIGFIAESVRVPTSTGSLVILVVAFYDDVKKPRITKKFINDIYRNAEKKNKKGYIKFTEEQNVSVDIIGMFGPATIIEGHETDTRTAYVPLKLSQVEQVPESVACACPSIIDIPITQASIYGWYDNELGSYTKMMGDLTFKIASEL